MNKSVSQFILHITLVGATLAQVACFQGKDGKTPNPNPAKAPVTSPAQTGGGAPSGGIAAPGEGPVVDGGGNVTEDGILLDIAEDQNLTEFDPIQTSAFKEVLSVILDDVSENIFYTRIYPIEGHTFFYPASILNDPNKCPFNDLKGNPELQPLFCASPTIDNFVYFSSYPKERIQIHCKDDLGYTEEAGLKKCLQRSLFGIGAGDELRQFFRKKQWYFSKVEIDSAYCKNNTMLKIKTKIAACQDENEVKIDLAVWKSLDKKNQAALLSHELLLAQIQILGRESYPKKKVQFERLLRKLNAQIFKKIEPKVITEITEKISSLYDKADEKVIDQESSWTSSFRGGVTVHKMGFDVLMKFHQSVLGDLCGPTLNFENFSKKVIQFIENEVLPFDFPIDNDYQALDPKSARYRFNQDWNMPPIQISIFETFYKQAKEGKIQTPDKKDLQSFCEIFAP